MFSMGSCSKRNHAHGRSKRVRICLACKMRSGERNRRLGRVNSYHPDRELYLTSGLNTHWHPIKLLYCAIDPDVAFSYHYLSPA